MPEITSAPSSPCRPERELGRRFGDLRGVQWRIDLGILPNSFSSIDDLRRLTANSRRRYAALRRRLLIDTLIPKTGSSSPDLVIDNPLSQNPDSTWGRFFRNAELERMLDQDLSRLYPEHGSYFQTPECQGMLRRVLLLWCLRNPDYGYRQGMHELLAPFLYVLHVDIEHLSEVRKTYEDHFTDKFDGFSFHESDLTYRFDFKKFSESLEGEIGPQKSPAMVTSFSELDPKIQDIVALSDAYGAEGELGIVLSEKFMEHDAYCLFDALMDGGGGAVAMSEFFSHYPSGAPHTGIPPVIEASSALYHLLAIVDASLHSHLVELGVEPQYFALRWLRVLFGREFALEHLLIIWDEIFAADNSKLHISDEDDAGSSFSVLDSSRGAFISALAVSMILHMRSSLLATENATSCLQRLLNFPEDVQLEKLIAKGKSLQGLAMEANSSSRPAYTSGYSQSKATVVRGHSLSSDSVCSRTAPPIVPESYWEEKWRVLHKDGESREVNVGKKIPNRIKGWSEKVKLRLSRTESDPSPSKLDRGKRAPRPAVRRSLLKDLAKQLGSEEDVEDLVSGEGLSRKDGGEENESSSKNSSFTGDDQCMNGNGGSEENSSIFSDPPSPSGGANDQGNESESSVASNISVNETDTDHNKVNPSRTDSEISPLPISYSGEDVNSSVEQNEEISGRLNEEISGKSSTSLKERKLLLGKFQWLWKFGKNGGDGASGKGVSESTTSSNIACLKQNEGGYSTSLDSPSMTSRGDAVDQNVMVTFKNLGHSMLENIQVIESAIQQDRSGQTGSTEKNSKNGFVGRGQVTAVAALKELRKISNILSEM